MLNYLSVKLGDAADHLPVTGNSPVLQPLEDIIDDEDQVTTIVNDLPPDWNMGTDIFLSAKVWLLYILHDCRSIHI